MIELTKADAASVDLFPVPAGKEGSIYIYTLA